MVEVIDEHLAGDHAAVRHHEVADHLEHAAFALTGFAWVVRRDPAATAAMRAAASTLIALMVLQAASLEQSGVDTTAATAGGMHLAFMFGGILSLGAIVLAAFVRRPADQPAWHGAEH